MMDIVTIAHLIATLFALIVILVVVVRAFGAGYFEEERRPIVFKLETQQISSQLIILTRYLRKLIASWEYLLLIIVFIAMASTLSYPVRDGETLSETLVPGDTGLTKDISILYSPSGLNLTSLPHGSVVATIYLGTLGEPAVIEAGERIFRVFNILIVNCSPGAAQIGQGSGFGEMLTSLCRLEESGAVYLITSKPRDITGYDKAILYYGDNKLEAGLRISGNDVLKTFENLPCVGKSISSFTRIMGYSGGLVVSGEFIKLFGLDTPSIAIITNISSTGGVERLRDTGAEIICGGAQEPGKIVMYTITRHRPVAQQLFDIAVAGLAGGVLLIIFNRSVITRIMPGSEAILISGGTYWISRLLPLVSMAIAELISVSLLVVSYSVFLSLEEGSDPFISPPGLLLISLISLTISFIHISRVKTSHPSISTTYIEKAIPAYGYSYVVEGLSHQSIARTIAESLETSEFFSVLEKEIMEKEGMINIRLRLLYRYAMGVGADVNTYISKHDEGSFIDIDIEPWSVDVSKGGILDSVARMILGRISGAIIVGRISRGFAKD